MSNYGNVEEAKVSRAAPFLLEIPRGVNLWDEFDIEDIKTETLEKWFSEAQSLNPEVYKDLKDMEGVPKSVLYELYPEIQMFGSNGYKVVQTFQLFREINHYLAEANDSTIVGAAFRKFAKRVSAAMWHEDGSIRGLFASHLDVPSEYKATVMCADNAKFQAFTSALYLENLLQVSTSLLRPLIIHVAFMFVAQNSVTREDPHVQAFTNHFNKDWEQLRTELAQSDIQVDMPYLI